MDKNADMPPPVENSARSLSQKGKTVENNVENSENPDKIGLFRMRKQKVFHIFHKRGVENLLP